MKNRYLAFIIIVSCLILLLAVFPSPEGYSAIWVNNYPKKAVVNSTINISFSIENGFDSNKTYAYAIYQDEELIGSYFVKIPKYKTVVINKTIPFKFRKNETSLISIVLNLEKSITLNIVAQKPIEIQSQYLDPSCVAFYAFRKGSKLYDFSENGNHGTIRGATWVSKGKYGNALEFDGVDDYVSIDASKFWSSFGNGNNFTFVAWIKPKRPGLKYRQSIMGSSHGNLLFSYTGDSYFEVCFSVESGWANDARVNIGQRRNWTFLAATYDGTYIVLYVDEKQYKFHRPDRTLARPAVINIGTGHIPPYPYYFNGFIAELHFYNRALNASEIKKSFKLNCDLIILETGENVQGDNEP